MNHAPAKGMGRPAESLTYFSWRLSSIALVLRGPFTREDFGCGAGHEHRRAIVRPLDLEVAAGEVGEHGAYRAAGKHTGDTDGTGAGATSQSDARTASRSHGDLAGALDLDDVHIDAAGECPVVFEKRAERFEWKGAHIRVVRHEWGFPIDTAVTASVPSPTSIGS